MKITKQQQLKQSRQQKLQHNFDIATTQYAGFIEIVEILVPANITKSQIDKLRREFTETSKPEFYKTLAVEQPEVLFHIGYTVRDIDIIAQLGTLHRGIKPPAKARKYNVDHNISLHLGGKNDAFCLMRRALNSLKDQIELLQELLNPSEEGVQTIKTLVPAMVNGQRINFIP